MPPEPSTAAGDRAAAAVMAGLLDQGRVVHGLAVALCAGAAVALLLAPGWPAGSFAAAILLAGLGETWIALRIGFDAECFRRIAGNGEGFDLDGFDRVLGRLGLMPPGKAGRPMEPRLAGARRLLVLQAIVTVAQLALALLAPLVACLLRS